MIFFCVLYPPPPPSEIRLPVEEVRAQEYGGLLVTGLLQRRK